MDNTNKQKLQDKESKRTKYRFEIYSVKVVLIE